MDGALLRVPAFVYQRLRCRALRDLAFWPPHRIAARQRRNLHQQIRHAYATVPFYRETMDAAGIRPDDIRAPEDLASLPLITRALFDDQPDLFASGAIADEDVLRIQSSGTSGKSRVIRLDRRAINESAVALYRFHVVVSSFVGRVWGHRRLELLRSRAVVQQFREHGRKPRLIPRRFRGETLTVPPTGPMLDVAEKINDFRPDVLVGYGSYLGALFRWATHRGFELVRPKVVAYSADAMSAADRRLIEEEFGIPVLSSYHSCETQLLGAECEERNGFHLETDRHAVRVVDAEGRTLGPGERGQIVVSNLVNRATVLLNYVLGDVVTLADRPCRCGRTTPLLAGIDGRTDDLIVLRTGDVIHSLAMVHAAQETPGVAQVQVIQEEVLSFRLRVVPAGSIDRASVAAALTASVRELVGGDARADVEWCDAIEPGPNGKVRVVVSRCRPEGARAALGP